MKTSNQSLIGGVAARRGQGIVLPVVLIFLVLMTMIGITVIRNVTMEEVMAGNSRNHQIAFQAAEEGLRHCEKIIIDAGVVPAQATGPFYNLNPADAQPLPAVPVFPDKTEPDANKNWKVAAKWGDAKYALAVPVKVGAPDFSTTRPLCMIERLTFPPTGGIVTTCPFRVTARGFGGGNANAEVILQSYINVPMGKWNPC